MTWKETHVMDERLMFIAEWQSGKKTISEVCREFGVSRKTGYKLIERYVAEGVDGLKDRSRAPHHHPHAVSEEIEAAIVTMRVENPTWGPKKVKFVLARDVPGESWPAESTIGQILDRHGLVRRRRRRHRGVPSPSPLSPVAAANDVWGIDFKGWFRTQDGSRCDPLTMTDLYSRYVLRLQALAKPDGDSVWPMVEAAFREFGLPTRMRSDNGPPFASTGAGGLSQLSVKLVKAGVRPERIQPGKPQQNGRHERMHRTLKAETASPPAESLRAQQRRFDNFRRVFNEVRPHEALGQQTPATLFQPPSRPYCGRLKEPEYPSNHQVRRVRQNGEIKWEGTKVFLSEALIGEPVGIAEVDDGIYSVHFGMILLGHLDQAANFSKGNLPDPATNQPPT